MEICLIVLQMSRIMVESKSPTWARCDLRMTRVKDPDRGQLLIFKELEWQTVRIEASSTVDKDLTPLRLLTNQARCRITIKKRLSGWFSSPSTSTVFFFLISSLLFSLLQSTLCFCRLLCYGFAIGHYFRWPLVGAHRLPIEGCS